MKLKSLVVTLSLSAGWCSLSLAAEEVGTTLEDFFTAAISYSPSLNVARERWHVGEARVDIANGQLLPQVNASANTNVNKSETRGTRQEYDGENYSVQLSQALFNWQAFSARKQAYLLESQTESEYYAQLAELLTVVADNYLSTLQAEDAVSSIKSELEATQNQVNQIQQLYNLQLAKVTDLYGAQARLAAVQTQRIDAESELAISKENLRASTGIEVGELLRLPTAITVTPLTGSLNEWLALTDENNKTIEARNYALQIADKAVSQRRGEYMPKVSLVLQHQTTNTGFNNSKLTDRVHNNYVGVNVSVPIYAGGSNRAQVRESLSQRNIAESELQQVTLDVQDRARTAYFQIKANESRIEAAKLLADSTSTTYTAMQRGFELGAVTSVDVLNALRDQFIAQRDLQKTRYDLIRWSLILYRESGTLSGEDMQKISEMLNAPPAQL
jgi:outer membrane protein